MNYLAHSWLSFQQPEIIVGNMISDFVKGKKRFNFPSTIQRGIMLHRSIDMFTDEHEITKQAKQFFKPVVGLYAGAFMDVVYDHFLATDINEFKDENELKQFSLFTYNVLEKHMHVLPERFALIFPYMKKQNWLYNYRTFSGIEKSFGGLMHRAKYLESNNAVFECFQKNYDALKIYYQSFFPAIKNFALHQLEAID